MTGLIRRREEDALPARARTVLPASASVRDALRICAGLAALVIALAGASCTFASEGFTGDPEPETAPWVEYPSTLELELRQPDGIDWLLPAVAIPVGEHIFVLDSGNDRLLRLDADGRHLATYDSLSDPRIALLRPMALATDGERLAIANTDAAELVILDLSGSFERAIPLPSVGPAGRPARPIGVTFLEGGGFAVSDAENHVVLFLDEQGEVERAVGSSVRAEGRDGFNVPSALTVDGEGNVYVVDTLNARVVQLSPEGRYLGQFSERGSNVGSLSRPKGVAVDPEGRLFVSDGLLAAVQVFGPDGEHLGLIGRPESFVPGTESTFEAPAGLWLSEDRLYVVDRFVGLLVFNVADR